jgi:looped-hinge helix DNA binding domain, AbrB family
MTSTIDAAGRLVIPKALRERAGLTPGTPVDIRFHEGAIEITPALRETGWETRHGIRFPVPPADAPELTADDIRDAIEAGRSERIDEASRAGR